MPDDVRLRHYGHCIADARRHSLRKETRGDSTEDDERTTERDGDQMSLFSVLSATATDADEIVDVFADHDEPEPDEAGVDITLDDSTESLVVDLRQLPPPAVGGVASPIGATFDRNERDRLRRINTDLTKQLVDLTGRSHSQVNAELNRRAGIAKVSEATIVQLNRRSRGAEEWLRQETRRKRFARFT